MHELTLSAVDIPRSLADTAQLRRRGGYRSSSYRKNVCLFTLNGSMNGWSFYNRFNGFGGF